MQNCVNDTSFSIAIDALRALARSVTFWVVLAGIILILGLVGPFDTFGDLRLPARIVYWALVGIGSALIGVFISTLVSTAAERRGLGPFYAVALGGALAGGPIAIWVAPVGGLFFGSEAAGIGSLLPYTTLIAALVTLLYERPSLTGETDSSDKPSAASLLAKLPAELGHEIVHLQAQDHYVRVTTQLGAALVLISLKEAEQDLAALDGFRVHRSWWVRRSHITGMRRENGRVLLQTTLGDSIPVGRAYRQAVLKALTPSDSQAP